MIPFQTPFHLISCTIKTGRLKTTFPTLPCKQVSVCDLGSADKNLQSKGEQPEETVTYGGIGSSDKLDDGGVGFFGNNCCEECSLQFPATVVLSICGFCQNSLIEWLVDHFFWLHPNLVFLLQVWFTI